jgi:hypothetical protein
VDATRRRSFAVFRNEKVVELVSLMAEGGMPTTAQALAIRAGIAQNLARAVLLKLSEAGIIMLLPRLGSRSPAYFAQADGIAWSHLVALCRSLALETPGPPTSSSVVTSEASRGVKHSDG